MFYFERLPMFYFFFFDFFFICLAERERERERERKKREREKEKREVNSPITLGGRRISSSAFLSRRPFRYYLPLASYGTMFAAK